MSDPAGVFFALLGFKRHTLGEMEHPALLEGQVCLLGSRNHRFIHQKVNGNVWRMKTTHMADQVVVLVKFTRAIAVYLDFRWG